MFINAEAGAGKSYLLTHLVLYLLSLNRLFILVSPFGVGAMNINGMTIHRFFGLPVTSSYITAEELADQVRFTTVMRYIIRNASALFIDEVQATYASVFDAVDIICRRERGVDEPFGGLPTWIFGHGC